MIGSGEVVRDGGTDEIELAMLGGGKRGDGRLKAESAGDGLALGGRAVVKKNEPAEDGTELLDAC